MARCLIALVVISALFILACSGDADQATPDPPATAARTPAATPNLPPAGEPAIEALRAYLEDNGLNGSRGSLTDPIDCALAEETSAEGEFCVEVNAGAYAPALAILFVTSRDTRDSWQIHVDLDVEASIWEVTDVDYLGVN